MPLLKKQVDSDRKNQNGRCCFAYSDFSHSTQPMQLKFRLHALTADMQLSALGDKAILLFYVVTIHNMQTTCNKKKKCITKSFSILCLKAESKSLNTSIMFWLRMIQSSFVISLMSSKRSPTSSGCISTPNAFRKVPIKNSNKHDKQFVQEVLSRLRPIKIDVNAIPNKEIIVISYYWTSLTYYVLMPFPLKVFDWSSCHSLPRRLAESLRSFNWYIAYVYLYYLEYCAINIKLHSP